jgi:hypothetical protein
MVLSSYESEAARPAGAVTAPGLVENAANGVAKKNDLRVATRCSLEGLGYLGMLSASPTDMGIACPNTTGKGGNNPLCAVPPFGPHVVQQTAQIVARFATSSLVRYVS